MSATFWPPFAPTTVTRNPDVLITLPDPPRPPGGPIVQPGVARHAGVTLVMMDVGPAAASFALGAPVTGTVRNVDVAAVGPASITQVVELSPLPFAAAHTFRKLPAGVPTFYLGYDRPPGDPADDDMLGAGAPLATVTSHAYIGVCFGDRTSLAPWSWIETLARAMTDAGEPTADVGSWAALAALYAGDRHVRVLDHAGRPANGRIMDVRITPAGGATEGPFALTLPAAPADADLEVAAGATSLPLSRGAQSTLFAAAGDVVEVRWRGDPTPGDAALAVHAVYETGDSAKPEQFLALPAGLTSMHVMATDVSRWFARRPANQGTSTLPRWVGDSRVEPFSDGIRVFRRLADDLIHATGAGNGAHLSAYIVRDFPISPGALDDDRNKVDTKITALMQRIVDSQGGMRVLGNRFVSLKTSPNDDAKELAMAAVILGTELTIYADIFGLADTNAVGFFVLLGGAILAYELIPHFLSATDPLVKKLEQSRETIPLLNAIDPGTAVWAPHTATTAGNPLAVPMPLGLDDFVERFGAWHQKMQVVKRTRDANGDIFAGYLGGIDINPNRLDAPGHQKAGPYHDVHAARHGSCGSPCRGDLRRAVELPSHRPPHVRTGGGGRLRSHRARRRAYLPRAEEAGCVRVSRSERRGAAGTVRPAPGLHRAHISARTVALRSGWGAHRVRRHRRGHRVGPRLHLHRGSILHAERVGAARHGEHLHRRTHRRRRALPTPPDHRAGRDRPTVRRPSTAQDLRGAEPCVGRAHARRLGVPAPHAR